MAGVKIWDWLPGFDFDEESDLKDFGSWFLDASHSYPRMMPMCAFYWNRHESYGHRAATEVLSIPNNKGVAFRTRKGNVYFTPLTVSDEDQIKKRETKFREAMRPFVEDFDSWWNKAKAELMEVYKRFKRFDPDKATNDELLCHLHELTPMNLRQWEIHFTGMLSAMMGWILFEQLCREWWGLTDSSPEFQKLMAGFDNKIYQVERRLWQLGESAIDKGLANTMMATEAREVISNVEQTAVGRQWVKEFREFLDEDGWRMQQLHVLYLPSWIDDPTPAIMAIKGFIAKGGGFPLEEIRAKLIREREEAEAALMQQVPEEQRDWFVMLLRLAQKASMFNEEHTYYCEYYCRAMIRRSLLAMGRRLVGGGSIDHPDDIFLLNPDEVERVIGAPEYHDMHYIVDRRRQEWEESCKVDPPPVLTTRSSIEEAFGMDLLPAKEVIGWKVVAGEIPVVRPELKADLYGMSGSPGVVEGQARVVTNIDQLGEIQPGDILVAPTTTPSWTSIFALIAGAVIDRGGPLSHAAIVSREYGIPAVLNTLEGTKKIKTGQRLKVDGNQGLVYIVD